MSAGVRLFFAACPEPVVAEQLTAATAVLSLAPHVRSVPRENLHMTLAFIGEVPEVQLPLARRLGAELHMSSFLIRFDAYEYWPKPRAVVAAARAIPKPLARGWQSLQQSLAGTGWAREPECFRPHVTLAKSVAHEPALPTLATVEWCVSSFSLMRSRSGAAASIYTVVDTWSLLDKDEKT